MQSTLTVLSWDANAFLVLFHLHEILSLIENETTKKRIYFKDWIVNKNRSQSPPLRDLSSSWMRLTLTVLIRDANALFVSFHLYQVLLAIENKSKKQRTFPKDMVANKNRSHPPALLTHRLP